MPLAAHLRELRKRLFRSALGILAGAVVGWLLSEPLLHAMSAPIASITAVEGRQSSLNFTNINEAFELRMQIAITVGFVVSAPIWLYQVAAFFMPGLSGKEKRFALGFVLTAVPLFLAGCAAGWFVLPNMVHVLASFAPADTTSVISARTYYDFVLKLVVIVGVAFVVPVLLVMLNLAGLLSATSILKSWRIALLVIALFTAIATPPSDVMSMFMLAVPMVALFYAAALIAWVHDRRQKKKLDRYEAEFMAAI
ncbi:twin-arginine translocase subunit TatC [Agreia sp. PsM10]|uniref:twin-arginine translocase subunit TatC n=1 Tax=Agreia sp. PsM10 TaxID=3030533 RepID=UPI00263AD93F|nr:twin-arginine translocase subunit TatC [Agreia sp. PsM10]MDN4641608.1 twin-arginine translocase subunit TatC [Agreia sp. PsM10]